MPAGERLKTGADSRTLRIRSRIIQAVFSADGKRLFLAGCVGQPKKKKNHKYPPFGRILAYDLTGQWGRA